MVLCSLKDKRSEYMWEKKPVDISTGEFRFGRTDQFLVFGLVVLKEVTRHCFLDLIIPGYHRSGSKKI
jgi:hypothetical protein